MSSSASFVSCYLMGGLGNQLFQIFATFAAAIDANLLGCVSVLGHVERRKTAPNLLELVFRAAPPVHNHLHKCVFVSAGRRKGVRIRTD